MARRISRLLVAGVACLALAYLIARSGLAAAALEAASPDAVPGFVRADPRLELQSAMALLEQSGGSLDAAVLKRVLDAAERAPLQEEPFIIAGIKSLLEQDDASAQRFLEEARRRDPRSRVARLLLLDIYGRTGNLPDTAAEMASLSRLVPGSGEHVVPELARMAQAPEGRQALAGVFRKHPALGERILEHLAAAGEDPALILSLAGPANVSAPAGDTGSWRVRLVGSLAGRGDAAQAHALWTRFTGLKRDPEDVYDGDFRQARGMPPFSWKAIESPDGAAETGKSGGLQAEYYGRRDAALVEQLLTLLPGRRYLLSLEASVQSGEADGSLAWRMVCGGVPEVLVQLPITGASGAFRSYAASFAVPPGCTTQWLRLVGTAKEFPRNQVISVRGMRIAKADGS